MVSCRHNLEVLAYIMHVHIRYAGTSNIVKSKCLLIPLNAAVFLQQRDQNTAFLPLLHYTLHTWSLTGLDEKLS
jgi:hypothetical protein